MGVRKNQSRLTKDEKSRFVAAVKELKASGVYDRYVSIHRRAMMDVRPDPAHGGPAFLPWHREYLWRFERELQKVDPTVTIPYWNWVRDRSPGAMPFTPDFLGGNGRRRDGMVTDGPFAYPTGEWTLRVRDMNRMPRFLARFMGSGMNLPTGRDIARVLRTKPFDTRPWDFGSDPRRSFRAALEDHHNAVHVWVGGTMGMATSPNDPVFWMHHAMIDRLWAMWQKRNPREPYRPRRNGPRGHKLNDPMWPWRRTRRQPTPRKVLDHSRLGYSYDDETRW